MEKTTITIEIDTAAKEQAEKVLSQLGMPVSTAVNIFLHQIWMTGGIPFDISLPVVPMVPREMDADRMTKEEIITDIEEGLEESRAGKGINAEEALTKFLEGRRKRIRDEAV